MRFFLGGSADIRVGSIAVALVLSAIAPAQGQSLVKPDDATNRHVATVVKSSTMRTVETERALPGQRHIGPNDSPFVNESLLTPYRSTPSDETPSGFRSKLPNTNLMLTNGSVWFRRASESGRRNGARVSVQLTY